MASELTFNDAPDFEAAKGWWNDWQLEHVHAWWWRPRTSTRRDCEDGIQRPWMVEGHQRRRGAATTGIEMSSRQPQISTAMMVTYVDGVGNPLDVDGEWVTPTLALWTPTGTRARQSTAIPEDDVEWQWSKSSSRIGPYTDITGDAAAETATYIAGFPGLGGCTCGSRRPTKTVRARGRPSWRHPMYPVRAFLSGNSGPAFPDDFRTLKRTDDQPPMAEADDGATEGDNVGDPVDRQR